MKHKIFFLILLSVSVPIMLCGSKGSGGVRFDSENVGPVGAAASQMARTFSNPIATGGSIAAMPDPYIVRDGEYYYACKSSDRGIAISRSTRLTAIDSFRKVWSLPDEGPAKPWNAKDLWAPELFHIGDRWYVYYAAGRRDLDGNSGFGSQRSGVLRSKTDDPLGEWEDMGMLYTGDDYRPGIEPTAENTEYAIDLTTFELNGRRYAVWSGNEKTDDIQQIRIARMSDPCTISSSLVVLSTPDQPWEKLAGTVNEGPSVLINEETGKVFIVYSCNGSWTKHYKLAWLQLDADKDPMVAANWTKSPGPVFDRCDNTSAPVAGVNGVGHCSFTRSPDGTEEWIVYHVMKFRHDNDGGGGWGTRYPFVQKFTWNADGTPDFGVPAGWGEALPLPSGETF